MKKFFISSNKFDRKCISVDLPSMAVPLEDFRSSAIGWPRIVSEYKDAAEGI